MVRLDRCHCAMALFWSFFPGVAMNTLPRRSFRREESNCWQAKPGISCRCLCRRIPHPPPSPFALGSEVKWSRYSFLSICTSAIANTSLQNRGLDSKSTAAFIFAVRCGKLCFQRRLPPVENNALPPSGKPQFLDKPREICYSLPHIKRARLEPAVKGEWNERNQSIIKSKIRQ